VVHDGGPDVAVGPDVGGTNGVEGDEQDHDVPLTLAGPPGHKYIMRHPAAVVNQLEE
jgi:ethanolamine ammonia-lyase large subunit